MKYSKNEKQYRNARIIADYLNGARVPDMADFYKITTQRIYTIMKHYRRKSNNAKHNYSQATIN
jgi:Mor family transcriptional regulator